jgi:hypothetical protein
MKAGTQYAEEHLAGVAEPEHQAGVDEVAELYRMPDDASVTQFLKENHAASPLLILAAPKLRKHFGDAAVALRALMDEDGSQTLYAVVLWPGDVDGVRQALDRFDDAWWIASSGAAACGLTFTYELI